MAKMKQIFNGYLTYKNVNYPLYPRGDYHTGWPVLSALGSYWSRQFGDKGKLLKIYRNNSILAAQTYINFIEAVGAVGRTSCPVFHRQVLYAIVIKESELLNGDNSTLKYGTTALYNGVYRYGESVNQVFAITSPENIKSIGTISNKVLDASVVWVNGQDFYFGSDGSLQLLNNPFTDGRFPITSILDESGNVTDRELVLWAFNSEQDLDYLYNHFGYILRYKAESSDEYKAFINAMLNAVVGGQSVGNLEWAIAAISGLPVVVDPVETVETIFYSGDATVVVTDKNAYRYPADSTVVVEKGDTVYASQVLVDTVRIYDLADMHGAELLIKDSYELSETVPTRAFVRQTTNSNIPIINNTSKVFPSDVNPSVVPFIPLFKSYLSGNYSGNIIFLNTESAFTTTREDDDENPIYEIKDVYGNTDDIELFWDSAHSNTVDGNRWYYFTGQLPCEAVNPAGFLIQNFLRPNAVVVLIRYNKLGNSTVTLDALKQLRLTVPPEKAIIVIINSDTSDPGTEVSDNIEEITASAITESDTIEFTSNVVTYYVSTCQ